MRSQYRHRLHCCLPSWQRCVCVVFSLGVKSLNRAPLLRDTLCPVHGVAAWAKLRAAGVWGGASSWSLPARSNITPSLVACGSLQIAEARYAPHHFMAYSLGRASAALLLQPARKRAHGHPVPNPRGGPPAAFSRRAFVEAKRSASGRGAADQL